MRKPTAFVALLALGLVSPAYADLPAPAARPRAPTLEGHLPRDVALTLGSTGAWLLGATVLSAPLAPSRCRWCTPNAFDRGVRDALVWNDRDAAELFSNVGIAAAWVNGLGALALVAHADGRLRDSAHDSLYVAEAVGVTMFLTTAVKLMAARARPAVYFQSPGFEAIAREERNLSFFSGHSALSFSLATAAGTVASLRGYRHAPWLWATGLSIAGFTAFARIAADKHYASDVLVGAAVGAGVGAGLPLWLHGRVREPSGPAEAVSWRVLVMPMAQGGTLVGLGARL
ncbi:MAG: phosphatase PAP2 family protein [Myxococcales bacterium]|nr:phosphatase PAP2 family protein [Myxococcales bacterium]